MIIKTKELPPRDHNMPITFSETFYSIQGEGYFTCLLYTSPSPRDRTRSRMPSSA